MRYSIIQYMRFGNANCTVLVKCTSFLMHSSSQPRSEIAFARYSTQYTFCTYLIHQPVPKACLIGSCALCILQSQTVGDVFVYYLTKHLLFIWFVWQSTLLKQLIQMFEGANILIMRPHIIAGYGIMFPVWAAPTVLL